MESQKNYGRGRIFVCSDYEVIKDVVGETCLRCVMIPVHSIEPMKSFISPTWFCPARGVGRGSTLGPASGSGVLELLSTLSLRVRSLQKRKKRASAEAKILVDP
jgi:hypothetical protein